MDIKRFSKLLDSVDRSYYEQVEVRCSRHGKNVWSIKNGDKLECQKCKWERENAKLKLDSMKNELLLTIEATYAKQFKCTNQKQSNVLLGIQKYADNFKNEKRNIILSGSTGTGKSMLCNIICTEIVNRSYIPNMNIIIKKSGEVLNDIRQTWKDPKKTEENYLNQLSRCKILVIDDFGQNDYRNNDHSDNMMSKLSYVIDERYKNNLVTIINSNLTKDQIFSILDERASDRLAENLVYISLNWESYRVKISNYEEW